MVLNVTVIHPRSRPDAFPRDDLESEGVRRPGRLVVDDPGGIARRLQGARTSVRPSMTVQMERVELVSVRDDYELRAWPRFASHTGVLGARLNAKVVPIMTSTHGSTSGTGSSGRAQ